MLTVHLAPSGDPDGSGVAVVRLDSERDLVCYSAVVRNISAPTEPAPGVGSAHIHGPLPATGIAIDLDSVFVGDGYREPTSPGTASAQTARPLMRCSPILSCSTSTCTMPSSREVPSKAASASASCIGSVGGPSSHEPPSPEPAGWAVSRVLTPQDTRMSSGTPVTARRRRAWRGGPRGVGPSSRPGRLPRLPGRAAPLWRLIRWGDAVSHRARTLAAASSARSADCAGHPMQ